jgi:hypothetical protein
MKFLIQWKESKEEEVHYFRVLDEGKIFPTARQLAEEDDDVFYWLTQEEALAIGADYDGGDWVVLRCACDECEEYEIENEGYQRARGAGIGV